MARRDILLWPDPRLSQPCAPVGSDEDLGALIADMFDTMYGAPGRGLAAPQIGVMQRVFVMDTGWKEGARTPKALINPQILSHSDTVAVQAEGCLSIPGLQVDVIRPADVTLAYTDATGALCEETFSGFAAACAQHELDHLDGRVTFDRLLPEARAKAEADYARLRA